MKRHLLQQLPICPQKYGWPWTEEIDENIYTSGVAWPKISIVIPTYNQGNYIEASIRSILLQNYPDLEIIIIDGKSKDNTMLLIQKYDQWITHWISEKDNGQAHAINKGIKKCHGNIFNWINSDDILAPLALYQIAITLQGNNTIAGNVLNFSEGKKTTDSTQNTNLDINNLLALSCNFHQPGIWYKLPSLLNIGNIPENYSYYFDKIFLIDYIMITHINTYSEATLVHFRFHNNSKTNTIRTNHINEIIEKYNKVLTLKKNLLYRNATSNGLKNQLIPEMLINNWKNNSSNTNKIMRIIKYIYLSIKYPSILKTKFYFIFLKKLVIAPDE